MVKGGGEALLEWSGDSHGSMKLLLDAAARSDVRQLISEVHLIPCDLTGRLSNVSGHRLLHPQLADSASLFVGNLITSLVMQLSTQMAPHVKDLVSALVARLETAQLMGLKCSILLVFARLVSSVHLFVLLSLVLDLVMQVCLPPSLRVCLATFL